MLTITGMLISARRIAALSTFRPTGMWKSFWMSGFITVRPMKPQTMLGIAASSSMTTFKISRVFPLENSDTKIAAPRPNGTAMSIATPVTLSVPASRASVPKRTLLIEVGYHSVLVRNWPVLNSLLTRIGAPSRKTKKKIAKTKRIALTPQMRMSSSMAFSP
jgi:hypothetical protein